MLWLENAGIMVGSYARGVNPNILLLVLVYVKFLSLVVVDEDGVLLLFLFFSFLLCFLLSLACL